ncbi:UNVERIFIED_CONTAM: hypothetical protein FKN15_068033 [Acipenser sinensis]
MVLKWLKSLQDNNINILAGSKHMALLNNKCTFISASSRLPPSHKHASANSLTKLAHRTHSQDKLQLPEEAAAAPPLQSWSSPPLSTEAQQQGDAPKLIIQLHNNIFEDMKSLIHLLAVSITSINSRLNDTDKRIASPLLRMKVKVCTCAVHYQNKFSEKWSVALALAKPSGTVSLHRATADPTGQDRGQTPRSCRTTASTIHLGHHTPRTTELDTSAPEHLHFSPPHKCTQRAERDLLYWDL